MSKTLLIIVGLACAVITAAGMMWYNYNDPLNTARRQLYDKDAAENKSDPGKYQHTLDILEQE